MRSRSNPRDRAMRFLVVTQVALLVMALFAPDPGASSRPVTESGTSADASSSPDPSVDPTATPTAEPSAAPTAEPTAAPTPEPTSAPTAEPTAAPTAAPTADPPRPLPPIRRRHPSGLLGTSSRSRRAPPHRPRPASSPLPGPTFPIRSPPSASPSSPSRPVPPWSSISAPTATSAASSSIASATAEAAPSDTEYAEPVVTAEDRLGPGHRHRARRAARSSPFSTPASMRSMPTSPASSFPGPASSMAPRGPPTRTATARPWRASSRP